MYLRLLIYLIISATTSTTLLAQKVTGLAGWDIYLDPGHSRMENVGIFGYSEAEKNLRVGLHLRELLLSNTDIDTVYNSRFTDQEAVSLTQRTDEANAIGASWFHSIHSDAGPPQLNSTLLLWGQLNTGAEKTPNGGQAMSNVIVDILARGMRTNSRGSIGDCSFYGCGSSFTGPYLSVNRQSTMPSELSEAGFHTSPTQNVLNMNAVWTRLEAYTFYWSFLKFHGIPRPAVKICTGIIWDVEAQHPVNGALVRLGGQEFSTDSYESLFNKYSSNPDQLHNGFYFLEDLASDTLEMFVAAEGFDNDTSTVVLVDSFFTFKDVDLISAVPPFVKTITPEQNETGIPITPEIVIEFSRRMNRASVETTLVIAPEVDKTYIWENEGRRLRIRPDSLEILTEYALTISGNALDLFAHPFDGNADGSGGDAYLLTFTTRPLDVNPPQVISAYPEQNAMAIENPPILTFVFDERLDPASVSANSVTLEIADDEVSVAGQLEHYVVSESSLLSFFPENTLRAATEYTVRILPGLEDLFGNALPTELSFNFTTQDFFYTITKIDDFDSGVADNWWEPQQSGSTGGIITEETSKGTNSLVVNLLSASQLSLQMDYGWDISAGSWLIREYLSGGAPRNVLFDDNYILQMYVFGDGSGNKIRFAVDDRVPNEAVSNHEVSPWFTIDWYGWRLVSWDMKNDGAGTWIGDGRLDGTLRIDSIQLTYTPGAAATGTFYFDDLRLVKATPVSVEEGSKPPVPEEIVLHQNYPNPFNPETTIKYTVAKKAQPVTLVIYDVLGRLVRTLVDEMQPVGEHSAQWNAKNDLGRDVGSGTYVYQLRVSDVTRTRKMALVR